MVQRRPDDDPTIEEEVPEFDGTRTDQLDDTYRFRIVAASESAHGAAGGDGHGQRHQKWLAAFHSPEAAATFDPVVPGVPDKPKTPR